MNKAFKSINKKIDEQDEFIKASIYIAGGFLLILAGYGVGRLIGMISF